MVKFEDGMQITKTWEGLPQNNESDSITDILVSCFLSPSKAESSLKAKYIELMELFHQHLLLSQLHSTFFSPSHVL